MYIDPIYLAIVIISACFVSGLIGAAYVDIRNYRNLSDNSNDTAGSY